MASVITKKVTKTQAKKVVNTMRAKKMTQERATLKRKGMKKEQKLQRVTKNIKRKDMKKRSSTKKVTKKEKVAMKVRKGTNTQQRFRQIIPGC